MTVLKVLLFLIFMFSQTLTYTQSNADSYADTAILQGLYNFSSKCFHINFRNGLKNSFYKIIREKKIRIAFLGGSITYNKGWRTKTMEYLQQKYPATQFDFVAAGIPSFGSVPDAFRFKKEVLKKGKV
jgi:hypothetical protein